MAIGRAIRLTGKRRKVELPPVERPLLSDFIRAFNNMVGQPMSLQEWNEHFYKMFQLPEAPNCLKRLQWDTHGEYPESPELTHMIRFMVASERYPHQDL